MPRIDPSQLLRTLSQLLSPTGGIRSSEEVARIVKLMQKFSKKLVSKCIYIHILRSSEPDLLEQFLTQKGWDLLNLWFSDSINGQNWYLCGDLVKLFAVCPMNPSRLKENVEINQAPKLIRQLSIDIRLDADIRNQAQQVLQQWMSVIRTPVQQPIAVQIEQPKAEVISTQQSAPVSDSDTKNVPLSEHVKKINGEVSHPRQVEQTKKSKSDESVDVDDLLGDDSESSDEESDVIRKKKAEIERRRKERDEKKSKELEREKKKAQERKEKAKLGYSKNELGNRGLVDSQEKERIREVARKMKEESESKSNKLTAGLGRIPKIPKKESEPETKKAKEGLSFGELMGGMDEKKPRTLIKNKSKDLMESLLNNSSPSRQKKEEKKRSSSDIKNKSSSTDLRGRARDDRHKSKDERRPSKDLTSEKYSRDKSGDSVKNSSKSNGIVSTAGNTTSTTTTTPSSPVVSTVSGTSSPTLKPKPLLGMPEKRTLKESSPDVKKASPKVIKESNFFGDVLGDIMKEQPKKRKRRLSEIKAERGAKEEATEKKRKEGEGEDVKKLATEIDKEEPPQQSPSGSEEEKMETGDDDDAPFAEPTSELPREVRGILVLAKGKQKKKRIQWRSEHELVDIKYFEMDDTERTNVWRQKSFEEMRKAELAREREKVRKDAGHDDEDGNDTRDWKMELIEFCDSEIKEQVERIWECYGRDSLEISAQEEREGRVLRSLFFNNLPTDPTEPDLGDRCGDLKSVMDIPGQDQSEGAADSLVDHSADGWPSPQDPNSRPSNNLSTISALLQDLKPGLLQGILAPNVTAPPSNLNSADAELFQAQAAAAAALVKQGEFNVSIPPPSIPPPTMPNNPNFDHSQNFNNGHPTDRPPPGYRGGYRGRHNFHNHRYPGGNHFARGGYRPHFRRDGRRDDYNKRPCKFWMDRGRCKEEDNCLYLHPGR